MAEDTRILFYGTRWCGDCRRARKLLNDLGVEYDFVDIDQDHEGEKLVKEKNHGNRSVPTIVFPDGSFLVEPSNETLSKKIDLFK